MSVYTYHDLAGCLVAALGFALILVGPGYLAAWATNLLGFRGRGFGERLIWSLPLSLGLTTMIAVMLSKYGSLGLACWVIGAAGVVGAGMIALDGVRSGGRLGRREWIIAGLGLLATLFVVGELIDVGWGNKLYMSVTVYDNALRTAFVDAVVRTGVPPGNPLYWTVSPNGVGHAAAMRYYYFWYVVCAMVVKIAGVTARQAMIASSVWAAFGFIATIWLYCRHFIPTGREADGLRRRTWITIALLAVTGLDVIPALVAYLQGMPTDPDMEWWSAGQVTSWVDTILWVPHHLAALVCCLFGFLLIWMSGQRGWRQRAAGGLAAGIGFAASFGLSTYVSVAFGMLMVAWLLWSLGWKEGRSRCGALLIAGLVAVVLLLPYLRELRAAGPNAGAKTQVFALSARQMIDPSSLAGLPGFRQLHARHWKAERQVAVLTLMVPGYIAELGFFAAVLAAALFWVRGRKGDAERTAIFLTLNGLFLSSFVRSTVIDTNDFGIRSMLVPQFFLLLLGGLLLDGTISVPRRWVKVGLGVLIVIGVVGTAYQTVLLRVYLPVEDGLGRRHLAGLAERNMALREVLGEWDARSPKSAVLQYDTRQAADFFNFSQLLNTPRQVATAMPECVVAFGGEPAPCERIKRELAELFLEPMGVDPGGAKDIRAENAGEAIEACRRLGVDELIATEWDPIWAARGSWVWSLPVVAATPRVRVVRCSTTTSQR